MQTVDTSLDACLICGMPTEEQLQVKHAVQAYLARAEYGDKTGLARRSSVAPITIDRLLRNENLRPESLRKIRRGLGLEPQQTRKLERDLISNPFSEIVAEMRSVADYLEAARWDIEDKIEKFGAFITFYHSKLDRFRVKLQETDETSN